MDDFVTDVKIKELIESITAMASLDFTKRIDISYNSNNLYDLLRLSVNMLSEELEDNVVSRKRLEENERILKEAQNLAKIGSFEHDLQSGEISFSDELFRIYGLEVNEVIPSLDLGLAYVYPDDKEEVLKRLDSLKNKSDDNNNNFWEQEYRIIRKDGTLGCVISKGNTYYNEDGVLVKAVGTIQDITKRKAVELKLQRQQQTTKKIENTLNCLNQITTQKEKGFTDQLKELLRFGCAKFGMIRGGLCEVEDDLCQFIEGVSLEDNVEKNNFFHLKESICSKIVEAGVLVAIKQISTSKFSKHTHHHNYKIESFIGIPINVNGKLYGALIFSNTIARVTDFSSTDKTIIEIMGQWIENQLEIKQNQDILINSVIEAQENEKKRIAEDLHDSVGPLLSILKLKTETLKSSLNNLNKEQENTFSDMVNILGKTAKELRAISYDLIPPELIDFGLLDAIQNLVEVINQTKTLSIELHVQYFEKRLEKPIELVVYRAIQEMLNNIIKHAKAKKVTIQFVKYENKLVIMVEDDGEGFDIETPSKGIGLKSLYSRISSLNGTLKIDSTKNAGTSVTISIPIK